MRAPRLTSWRASCVFGALLWACGSTENAAPSSGLSAQAYCAALADQECTAFAGCCSLTPDDCRGKAVATCLASVNALSSFGMKFDGTSAQPCLDTTGALYANCAYVTGNVPAYLARVAACHPLAVGTIAPGGACQYDNSCLSAPGSVSKCQSSSGQRACVATPVLKAGDDCHSGVGECAVGTFCDGACKQLKAAGEVCDDNSECATSVCAGTCTVPDQAYLCKTITG